MHRDRFVSKKTIYRANPSIHIYTELKICSFLQLFSQIVSTRRKPTAHSNPQRHLLILTSNIPLWCLRKMHQSINTCWAISVWTKAAAFTGVVIMVTVKVEAHESHHFHTHQNYSVSTHDLYESICVSPLIYSICLSIVLCRWRPCLETSTATTFIFV